MSATQETPFNALKKLLKKVSDLYSIVISDKDGAIFGQVSVQDMPSFVPVLIRQPGQPQLKIDAPSSAFTASSDRADRLGVGASLSITSVYDQYALIQYNHYPLVISFYVGLEANKGLISNIVNEVKEITEKLRQAVNEDSKESSMDFNNH